MSNSMSFVTPNKFCSNWKHAWHQAGSCCSSQAHNTSLGLCGAVPGKRFVTFELMVANPVLCLCLCAVVRMMDWVSMSDLQMGYGVLKNVVQCLAEHMHWIAASAAKQREMYWHELVWIGTTCVNILVYWYQHPGAWTFKMSPHCDTGTVWASWKDLKQF